MCRVVGLVMLLLSMVSVMLRDLRCVCADLGRQPSSRLAGCSIQCVLVTGSIDSASGEGLMFS